MQTTCGIDKYQIMPVLAGKVYASLGNLDRIALSHVKNRDAELRTNYFQLIDRGRTVYVTRDEQGTSLLLFFEQTSEFGAVGRFTGALQTNHHDNGRRIGGDGICGHSGRQAGRSVPR